MQSSIGGTYRGPGRGQEGSVEFSESLHPCSSSGSSISMPSRSRKTLGKRHRDAREWIDLKDPTCLHNANWERYYRGQVIPEAEWEPFLASMRLPLPVALRFNQTAGGDAKKCEADFLHEFGTTMALRPVAFLPGAQQGPMSRSDLKRNVSFKAAKVVVHGLNEIGRLSRQEVVSMIPPLLLDVQPDDMVLDMCAAPGSKTQQLLESLAVGPGGCVVANDINAGRLDILYRQIGRSPANQARSMVTNHDAARFPVLGRTRFDRVLCDVMCSGDGTLRKSVDLWPRWNAIMGPSLNNAQCNVLQRGMLLCKQGATLVYSTCSLNPVEDEAVIATCLKWARGAFELVDAAVETKAAREGTLRWYPGVATWRVTSRDASKSFATLEDSQRDGDERFRYSASMFPPSPDEQASLHLERCMRVPPHLQDTGGFFIAKLKCLREMRSTTNLSGKPEGASKNVLAAWQTLAEAGADLLATVKQNLEMDRDDCAAFPFDDILLRKESGREAKMYLANAASRQVLSDLGYRCVAIGCKVFESPAKRSLSLLRFTLEGAEALASLLPPRLLLECTTPAALLELLERYKKLEQRPSTATMPFPAAGFCECVSRPSRLPAHFLIRVVLGKGIGALFMAGDVENPTAPPEAASVRLRFEVHHLALLRYALNLPVITVTPVDTEKEQRGDGDSAEDNDSEEAESEEEPTPDD